MEFLRNRCSPAFRGETCVSGTRPGRTPTTIHPLQLESLQHQESATRTHPVLVSRRPHQHRQSQQERDQPLGTTRIEQLLDRIRPYLAFDPDELAAQQADWDSMLRPPTVEEVVREHEAQTLVQRVTGWFGKEIAGKPEYAAAKITDSQTALYDLIGLPKDRNRLNLSADDIANGKYTNEYVHFSVTKRQAALGEGGSTRARSRGGRGGGAPDGYLWIKAGMYGPAEKTMPEYAVKDVPLECSLESWLLSRPPNLANSSFDVPSYIGVGRAKTSSPITSTSSIDSGSTFTSPASSNSSIDSLKPWIKRARSVVSEAYGQSG